MLKNWNGKEDSAKKDQIIPINGMLKNPRYVSSKSSTIK